MMLLQIQFFDNAPCTPKTQGDASLSELAFFAKLSGQVEKTCPLLFAREYGKIYFMTLTS